MENVSGASSPTTFSIQIVLNLLKIRSVIKSHSYM